MSDANKRQFEIASHIDRPDEQSTEANDRNFSDMPDGNLASAQDAEEDRVLTKVADLLDDVTESDQGSPPSLNAIAPSHKTPASNEMTELEEIPSGEIPSGEIPSGEIPSGEIPSGEIPSGEIPSLNSTWHRTSLNRHWPQQDVDVPDNDVPDNDVPENAVDGLPKIEPLQGAPSGKPSPGEGDSIDAEKQHQSLGAEQTPESNADSNISIKGRGDGVAIELGNGDWNRLMARLDARLEQAAAFFRGGQVSLDVGSRPLVETELDEVCGILQKYGLVVGIIRTGSDRTFQSALNLGLSTTMENAGGDLQTEATFAASNLGGQTHFVYRGNLRSGQVLQRQESILVIGDVNPGGHLISAGDILVWGRLRGVAHAGAEGDLNVIVGALLLEPTQLRIANIIAIDDSQKDGRRREQQQGEEKPAQVAYISEGKLVVQPWQAARRGFRSVLLGS